MPLYELGNDLISKVTETSFAEHGIKERNEPEIFFEGDGYYVARNWGVGNVDGFMDKISVRFKDITDEKSVTL